MLISTEKKKSNIAEYVLYMWQVEDTIRAYSFDLKQIEKNIIDLYEQNDDVKKEIKNWYAGLIDLMNEEQITQKGHLQFVNNVVSELNNLHISLLSGQGEESYKKLYEEASSNIITFRTKLGEKFEATDEVGVCLTALYAMLLMRLQKREISKDTIDAMTTFSKFLALLSVKYKTLIRGIY